MNTASNTSKVTSAWKGIWWVQNLFFSEGKQTDTIIEKRKEEKSGVCVCACMWLRERESESAGVPWRAVLHKNFSLLLCWVGRQSDVTYIPSQFFSCFPQAKCLHRHPPGNEIYRKSNISFFEIDGRKNKVSWGYLAFSIVRWEIMDIMAYLARYNFAYMSGSPVQDIVRVFLLADSINWVKMKSCTNNGTGFAVFLCVADGGVTVDFLVWWNIELKACGAVEHPNP